MIKWIRKNLKNYRESWLKKEQPLTTPRKLNAEQIFMFALLGMLNVLDYFVTIIALFVARGTIQEQNGLFAGMLESNYLFALLIKFVILGFGMIFFYEKLTHAGKSYSAIRGLFMLLVTLYMLVVISNVLHLNFAGGILGW